MNNRRRDKFIYIYENFIKTYRDRYYKNIFNENSKYYFDLRVPFVFILFIVSVFFFYVTKFDLFVIFLLFLFDTFMIITLNGFLNIYSLKQNKSFEKIIKRYGYSSILEYEKDLKLYISGNKGFYNELLNSLMNKYDISDDTLKVTDVDGDVFYIWLSNDSDTLYMLNTNLYNRPKVKKYNVSDIRYFRKDSKNDRVVFYYLTEILLFETKSLKVFKYLLEDKYYNNISVYDPEVFVSDYENYMGIRKKVSKKLYSKRINKSFKYLRFSIMFIIFFILLIITRNYVSIKYLIDVLICLVFLLYLFFFYKVDVLEEKNDDEYLNDIIDNESKIYFEEFKFALGIKNKYDLVFNLNNDPYLVWYSNGYFHLFLNKPTYNVIYMVINKKNVLYYKLDGKVCLLKTNVKTFVFRKDAKQVFDKILIKKDYETVKKLTN